MTKRIQAVVSALMFLFSIQAVALTDAQTCQLQYSDTVKSCANDLDNLEPKLRAGAQKACVQAAKTEKELCNSGVNLCISACQATYDNNVATCNATYDPASCLGNLACEAFVTAQRSACVSASVDVLNACTQSCNQ